MGQGQTAPAGSSPRPPGLAKDCPNVTAVVTAGMGSTGHDAEVTWANFDGSSLASPSSFIRSWCSDSAITLDLLPFIFRFLLAGQPSYGKVWICFTMAAWLFTLIMRTD
ncbi:hypothetical protein DAI22_10g072300 [Oryza sativa Japonica Group]|nr:hypothetical protein DAI22_10g072300 [Oryza sativa Japonica Group]